MSTPPVAPKSLSFVPPSLAASPSAFSASALVKREQGATLLLFALAPFFGGVTEFPLDDVLFKRLHPLIKRTAQSRKVRVLQESLTAYAASLQSCAFIVDFTPFLVKEF